ncbi:MAG: hypothetical protein ASARMPREDX12_004254 [Alectoria sarmentosa]|nr:MAG: hypothetical protein ASARMPREDX12_004254 [Alectoria sarmentosa]
MSCVAELDAILQSMLALKPPGVTGGKIQSITTLCNANIQSETVLIQRVYTHFKKAPASHKLGVLYVVDSVTRAWVEQARKAGQTFGPSAPDGTFAAGVNRVTELLPSFMTDILTNCPEEQKVRSLESMLGAMDQMVISIDPRSTTPIGTPPKEFIPFNDSNGNFAAAGAPRADTSQILKALADMAKTNTTAAPAMPSQASPINIPNLQNAYQQHMNSSVNPATSAPYGHSVNVPGAAIGPNPFAVNQGMPGGQTNVHANPVMPQGTTPEALQQQVQLIQMLQAQGVPQDQWATVLQVLMAAGTVGGGVASAPAQPSWQQQNGGRDDSSQAIVRDHDRQVAIIDVVNRLHPVVVIAPATAIMVVAADRAAKREPEMNIDKEAHQLPIYDLSLPPNHIKVLSRTLFVGGVTSSDDVLRGIFQGFGIVQTCIVNVDKRHAFVKMLSRSDAVTAKEGMERYKSAEMQLRTRWGVGFGPRDCSDYQTGISIIPVDRLTDADRKWMLSAEYGGTGGKPIEPGLVVEEPDIEIGAGVSSKAISRRMATDKGGQQGPRSTRDPPSNSNPPPQQQRYRQPERNDNRDNNTIGVAPAVPGFGFQFPGMPNGFQFPPGFVMPGTTPAQPPPPGAT